LPKIEKLDHVCEVCTLGKQHRLPFPKGRSWRAKQPLQLVHTDICGPLVPVSHGGNKYLIIFIDDYSRKTWVYFLKEKSAAFVVFKNFKNLVENESGYKIKTLRSDKGGWVHLQATSRFLQASRHSSTIYNCIYSTTEWSGWEKEPHYSRHGANNV
jgi:Integrase core domain